MIYTAAYIEDAVLRDGTRVRLRLIRPEDKAALRAGFEKLSPASRYLRFFAPKDTLTDTELAYLTECDGIDHVAIAAAHIDDNGGEGEGLGVARFIRGKADRATAEAAVAVLDEIQGRGLGTLLLARLIAAARERGIERFTCDVLGDNAPMLELIANFAPDRMVGIGSGVVSIEFALPEVEPQAPAAEPPRESALYRFFRMVAEGALEWREAIARLAMRDHHDD